MRRSARSRRPQQAGIGGLLREGAVLLGGAALRNPMAVGGTTAFIVTLAYVSANAMWYQPHPHPAAYFSTRVELGHDPLAERFPEPGDAAPEQPARPAAAPQPARESTDDVSALIEQETTSALPKGDPQVRLVQDVLKTLDLYDGAVDGLTGPQTTKAVQRYQKLVGLEPTGRIDRALLQQLGAVDDEAPAPAVPGMMQELPSAAPVPRPKEGTTASIASAPAARPARATDPMIVRIQAGLKAFGHDGIELDGIVGARTRAAIREFQSLFGLPETGEPDAALFAKMREVGLTD